MKMFEFILFCLASVGATNIVVDSHIFAPIRDWIFEYLPEKISYWIRCYQCFGFWSGLIFGLILISVDPFIVFACGCAGSFLSEFAAVFINYLESKSVIDLQE